jgi:transcriptional regulator with XRE-family HTH domain
MCSEERLHKLWGKNIRSFRQAKDKREKRKGSGMEAMAQALNVAPETVSRWEGGHLVPRDCRKIAIAEYLGVKPERIYPLVRL